jgi:hypothetical protein
MHANMTQAAARRAALLSGGKRQSRKTKRQSRKARKASRRA